MNQPPPTNQNSQGVPPPNNNMYYQQGQGQGQIQGQGTTTGPPTNNMYNNNQYYQQGQVQGQGQGQGQVQGQGTTTGPPTNNMYNQTPPTPQNYPQNQQTSPQGLGQGQQIQGQGQQIQGQGQGQQIQGQGQGQQINSGNHQYDTNQWAQQQYNNYPQRSQQTDPTLPNMQNLSISNTNQQGQGQVQGQGQQLNYQTPMNQYNPTGASQQGQGQGQVQGQGQGQVQGQGQGQVQFQQFNPYANQSQQQFNPNQQQFGQTPMMNNPNQQFNPNQQQFSQLPNVQAGPGQQLQPQAPKIASSQVPSTTTILDQYKGFYYKTTQEPTLPPPSSVQQFCYDTGNSKPNFMRSSLYTIPENEDTLNQTHIPFVIHTTPFSAPNNVDEAVVPQIIHSGGPVQCRRCHAYINPFNQFTNGGKYFICKFCEFENPVDKEYFSATLPNGLRTDYDQRPELKHGSYEFLLSNPVPKELPAYIFVIEVSAYTVQTGILNVVIESLKRILNDSSLQNNLPSRIGIITFDTEVQFWSFKKTYNTPQMKVLSRNSVFVPIDDGFLVDYKESKHLIDYFFENIPQFFKYPPAINRDFAFGSAVQSATLALEKCGGRVFTFTSNLPKGTPGAIEKREKSLLPSSKALNDFYKPVYTQCVKMNVSVDIFCIPAETCDLPTTGQLSNHTGGNIYCYPNYNPEYHADQLYADIVTDATLEFGINATAKVRCSAGITVQSHYGHYTEVSNEVQFAGISSGKTLSSVIKYDDKLKPKSKAYVQFAMIYTNLRGENRIRVHNLRFQSDSAIANYFKDADLDSIITYFARVASKDISSNGASNIRTQIVDKSVDILSSYRKYCASDKAPTQLILPELFKLLPIYILALMKTPPFRLSVDISPDLRFYYMHLYTSLPPSKLIPLIYPKFYPIHNLQPQEGLRNPNITLSSDQPNNYGTIVLPVFTRLSSDQFAQNGIYIVDDGRTIQFWIQQFASTYHINCLFGVESIVGFNSKKLYQLYESTKEENNEYHQKVDNIVNAITQLRGYSFRTLQFSQSVQSDPMDAYFRSIFFEDKGVDSISYVDFLCQVHKQIQNKLS